MFKIEVQADSIPQLADRLLALGAQLSIPAEVGLQRTISAIMPEVAEAAKAKPGKLKKTTGDVSKATAEAGENAVASTAGTTTNSTMSTTSSTATSGASPSDVESMADAAQEEPTPEVEAEVVGGIVAADLDFDKDVAPHVLDLVGRKGREAMTGILDQFGAARASEVPEAQWPELLGKIAEAVA